MAFTVIQLRNYPELKAIVKAAFPSYKKRYAAYTVTTEVTIRSTYWDGGSRNEYVAVELSTMRSAGAPQYDPPQFGGPRVSPKCELPAGVAVVEGGYFCGQVSRAHVYIHPDNVQRFLVKQ